MAFPETEVRGDTRYRAWVKVLGHLQNLGGADPKNNPKKGDGLRRILQKILGALTSAGAPEPVPVLAATLRVASWSVTDVVPVTAQIERSLDGSTSWAVFSSPAWATASLSQVNSGWYYRVKGLDGSSAGVTEYSNIVQVPLHATATAWAAQVVTNGGAAPSSLSTRAQSDYCYDIDLNGLTGNLKAVNFFAPDSLIAALTPLIHVEGSALWTNNAFLLADLSVNGLQGDGATKYMDTGVIPSHYGTTGNDGLTVYVQGNNGTSVPACQVEIGNSKPSAPVIQLRLYFCQSIQVTMHCTVPGGGAGPDMTVAATTGYRGYICGVRTGLNVRNLYLANTTTPHASFFNDAVADTLQSAPNTTMPVFCSYENTPSTTPSNFSKKRLSYVAFHDGWATSASLANYNAIVACRTLLGGGLDTGPNTP